MSRAWMPIYWGDYLRDTRDLTTLQHGAYLLLIAHYWQHGSLPDSEKQLAAIAGLSVLRWRSIAPPIKAKFTAGWTHKRIEAEIIKSERISNQKAIAGRIGGRKSGIAKAVLKGKRILQAAASEPLASRLSSREAAEQAETKHPRSNHKEDITTTSQDAAKGLANLGVASPELAEQIRAKWGAR